MVVQRIRTANSHQQLHLHQASGSDPVSASSEYSYSAPPVTRMRLPSVPASPSESSSEEFGVRQATYQPLPIARDMTASPIETAEASTSPFADPPGVFGSRASPKLVPTPSLSSPTSSSSHASPPPLPVSPRRRGTGEVAARIAAYERRMSQADFPSTIPTKTPSPPAASSKLPDGGGHVSKTVWGLVQKPELFVANPDHSGSS